MKNFAITGLAATLCLAFTFSAMATETVTMTKSQLRQDIKTICKQSVDPRACKKDTGAVKSSCKADINAKACTDAVAKLKSDHPAAM